MIKQYLPALLLALIAGACGQSSAPTATSAPQTAAAPAAPAPPAPPISTETPPTENGLYAAKNACPFEGCALRLWRVEKSVDLRDAPTASATVVSTAPAGEWVKATESVDYLVPERGVVVKDIDKLKAGDVIYRLESQGEGVFTVWRRGEMLSWTDEGERDDSDPHISSGVKWTTLPDDIPAKAKADEALGAGWWARVTRPNGNSGWALVDKNFGCTDQLGGDDECEAHQKDAAKPSPT